jgi:hypothetical protein
MMTITDLDTNLITPSTLSESLVSINDPTAAAHALHIEIENDLLELNSEAHHGAMSPKEIKEHESFIFHCLKLGHLVAFLLITVGFYLK